MPAQQDYSIILNSDDEMEFTNRNRMFIEGVFIIGSHYKKFSSALIQTSTA